MLMAWGDRRLRRSEACLYGLPTPANPTSTTIPALALQTLDTSGWLQLAGFGSAVVLPFWIATMFGWSTGGMSEVWGESVGASASYALHGVQTAAFYAGLALLWPSP